MTDYIANINEYPIGGDNFDSQWTLKFLYFANGTDYGANSVTTYDLSSYLPNDNFDYEIAFSGWGRTPSGSGNVNIRVMTGNRTYTEVYNYGCRMMTTEYHSTSTYKCSGNLIIPIFANNRYVSVANTSSNSAGGSGFYALGYRRLGTNE